MAMARVVKPALSMAAVAGGMALGLAHRARHTALYRPVLERHTLSAPANHPGLAGLRLGFFTDPHIGPLMSSSDVERALGVLFAASPHLLLLGGDYICESPRFAEEAAAAIGPYAAQAPLGALAVLGNHDHANDAPRLATRFEERGIRVLRNEAVRIAHGPADLWVAGIDDALLGSPSPECAFADVPGDAAAIALWHEPDWADEAARRGAVLQLSGHSHGGQVRLPFLGALATPPGARRFVTGFDRACGMPVYTSRGAGVFRPPLRFRCPPEVTIIEFA
jgi:predicted MPP superfamily phosphohydrolase